MSKDHTLPGWLAVAIAVFVLLLRTRISSSWGAGW